MAKDGREVILEGNAIPRVVEGKVIATQSFFRDVTERKKTEEALQRNYDTQTAVNSLLRRSLEDIPLEEFLDFALKLVLAIPWLSLQSRGCIFLVEDDPKVLIMKVQNGLADPIQNACSRVPFGRCLCGRAAWTRQIQFADHLDERHETRYDGIYPHGEYCVPIISSGRVLGVMNLYLKEGHSRDAGEEAFLHSIADALAGIIDRRRAEEALHQSEAKFRTLAETTSVAIFIYQERFRYLNPAAEVLSGYSAEEARGISFWEVVHPDFREVVKQRGIARLQGEAVPSHYEFKIVTKAGEERWVDFRAGITQYEGRPAGMGMAHDITEQKLYRERLEEMQRQQKALLNNIPDIAWLKDRESRFIAVNEAFGRSCGVRPEDLVSKTDLDIWPLELAERYRADDREVMESGVPKRVEEALEDKEKGTRTWIETIKTPIYDAAGTITGTVGIARDISERKAAQEKIEEQAALLDVASDGILVTDLAGRILYWNRGAEALWGWSAQEALGRSPWDFLNAEVSPQYREAKEAVLREGKWSGELPEITKEGKNIIVGSHWTLVKDGEGRAKSILSVNRDLTEQKAVEAQLFRSQRLDSLGMLAGGIAHDLNNILAPILMNVELLQRKLTDAQAQKMLASVSATAQRGADIVKQILTFSRGAEGELSLLSPKYLLKEIVQIAKETFPKSIQIETKIARDLWTFSGNATQLHQVLLNLCVNARDAMPHGGTLTISAENAHLDESYARMHPEAKPGPYLLFSVSDTGTGIPASFLDHIFDPFFTTKDRGHGTGLGLSTVHSIVKGHGGFLTVYSEVGMGSRFQVYLPASPAGMVQPQPTEAMPSASGKGELILIVEDEAPLRDIAQATLEDHGYRVLVASDGSEAVALFAQQPGEIQVVITDLAMPIMDGHATIRALQKIRPEVKILAVSGMAWDKATAGADRAAVKAFLQKPFTAERLLQTLAEVLRGEETGVSGQGPATGNT